ncbi:phage protein [Sulfuriferula multivorans]|uniref:Phage protein n=1 Tax=Sulfuriferula multivorans TaxID=1559896 RepID=A0A401JF00_9PROT|nr:phage tail protein [Sulfuriferula multivorans]GBL46207.1 phage protein [Sulfuriferula multivorans]
MGSSSSSQVVGYKYYLGMHQVYCHGPVDEVSKIRVGEKTVWTGSVTANQQITIAAEDAFGGTKKEGGVSGAVDIAFGAVGQPVNDYLASKLTGTPVPAFRGVLSLVLRQVYLAAMNPYIKPWAIFAKRVPRQWYPAKAEISGNANPAHIIYDVLTNSQYGMGYNAADLDLASFTSVADTLFAENFGLSILWEGQQSIEDFIGDILQHIDASLYVKTTTGLFTLKLARNDYLVSSLPILSGNNVIRVDRFSQALPGELTGEVVLKYHDRDAGKDASVSVQDIAVIQMQGGQVVSVTRDFKGIPDGTLAAAVAARELSTLSTPLIRASLICNRTVWGLNLGDVFRLQWAPYGVTDIVMRIASIDYGDLTDGQIRIECVQDIFSAAHAVFAAPQPSSWTSPSSAPAACPQRILFEVPYWTLVREVIGQFPSLFADLDPLSGLVGASGTRPSGDAYNYELWDRTGAVAYGKKANGSFCPTAVLANSIGVTDTIINIINPTALGDVQIDKWAILGGEMLKVKAVGTSTVTFARGVLDTVPIAHSAGEIIYFADSRNAIDKTEWSSGEIVNIKLLPTTSLGTLAEAAAPADSITLNARYIRPYPPGKLLINGVAYPATIVGQLTVDWAHRDRLQQTAYLVEQSEVSIGPEAGTTYTLRIYGDGGTLKRTVTALAGTTYTYLTTDEQTDNGGIVNTSLRIELEAVRAGYVSWTKHNVSFSR